ncbi:uncharacterized protein TNCV_2359561 [Trichonephila clavipes]|nr:uncharacterized protein TNCV_2359561 [Trichonephila clavipes]
MLILGYFLKRNLEHTQWDIEDNLDQLEGGWLGDNGFDDENSDDECHDSDEIRSTKCLSDNREEGCSVDRHPILHAIPPNGTFELLENIKSTGEIIRERPIGQCKFSENYTWKKPGWYVLSARAHFGNDWEGVKYFSSKS